MRKKPFRILVLAALSILVLLALIPYFGGNRGIEPGDGTTRTDRAKRIAEKRWGKVCGATNVTITRGEIGGTSRRLAQANYQYPSGGVDDASRYYNCRVTLRPGPISTPVFCTVVAHEYGHLAGYRSAQGSQYTKGGLIDPHHSSNRRSVMYPSQQSIWPGCGKGTATQESFDEHKDPSPTVVLLHGGGWVGGGPDTMKPWSEDLGSHGIRTVRLSYRLGNVENAINDVREQVKAIPEPVIAYGISAGGTIAAALAARGEVAGAINLVGPTDFTTWATPNGLYLMAFQLRMTAQMKRDASPINMLDGRQTPQLVQMGLADPLVTPDQGALYVRKAKTGQPDTRLTLMAGSHNQFPVYRDQARRWITDRWR